MGGLTPAFSGAVSGIPRNYESRASRPPLQRIVMPTYGKSVFSFFVAALVPGEKQYCQPILDSFPGLVGSYQFRIFGDYKGFAY